MLLGLFNFWSRKSLARVLTKTYRVKVHGVFFELRKLSPIDYVAGARAIQMQFDTYKTNPEMKQLDLILTNADKIREHYIDVFMSSVVEPKLVRKREDSEKGIWVENLFNDWDLANDLYMSILEVTHGKKKLKSLMSQKKSS